MKGLLLAGGHGTRLRPLTFTGNKHMLPIANKPMLFYGLEHLKQAGVRDVGVVLGPVKEGVVEALGDGSAFGLKVTYINQGDPLGLAHAVKVSSQFLQDEPFVMYLGDNMLDQGIRPLTRVFEERNSDAVIGLTHVKNPQQFGVVELQDGRIKHLVEKPTNPPSDLALVGVYVFGPAIIDAVNNIAPSWRNELEITDAIQYLVDKGMRVDTQLVQGWWKDTGRPDDLLEANRLVLSSMELKQDGIVEEGSAVIGRVGIGEGTRVRRGARINGPTIIGKRCEIGPTAKIGPYTSIGDGVKVQSGEIKNSIVMQDCTIECGRLISDSIVSKNTRILSSDTSPSKALRLIVGESTEVFV